eukprot:3533173-Prymnesium_polylepis.2
MACVDPTSTRAPAPTRRAIIHLGCGGRVTPVARCHGKRRRGGILATVDAAALGAKVALRRAPRRILARTAILATSFARISLIRAGGTTATPGLAVGVLVKARRALDRCSGPWMLSVSALRTDQTPTFTCVRLKSAGHTSLAVALALGRLMVACGRVAMRELIGE